MISFRETLIPEALILTGKLAGVIRESLRDANRPMSAAAVLDETGLFRSWKLYIGLAIVISTRDVSKPALSKDNYCDLSAENR